MSDPDDVVIGKSGRGYMKPHIILDIIGVAVPQCVSDDRGESQRGETLHIKHEERT